MQSVGMKWKSRMLLGSAVMALLVCLAPVSRAATDADGDGYPEATDCDDHDDSVWSLPGEAQGLHFTSRTTFVWQTGVDLGGTASSFHFDTLRSSSASGFSTAPPASCSDPDGLSSSTTDTAVPAAGHAFFYLVRLRNSCGSGSLGASSSGVPRSGISCDCTALCNDGQACTTDRCADGVCAHDPVTTGVSEAPQSVAVCPGEDAHFSVRGVPDGSTLHYQWRKNGAIVGTDSPALTLSAVGLADNGAQITCAVTGACAATTSPAATLTVFPSSASCAGGGSGYEAPNGASTLANPGDPDDSSGEFSLNNEGFRDFGAVHLFSGEFHLEAVDLAIAGRGFDFVWSRRYQSRTGQLTSMGQNWDFSYNRRIVLSGGTVLVYGGNGRVDAYAPSPTGCFKSPGFFRELCPQPDGSFAMYFPSHVTWTFRALDGSPAQGRLGSIQDPDLNTMSFSYDTGGRLTTIIDTLGKPITVAYNSDGFISSLTDSGGRQVLYDYYTSLDAEGMPADLASVTRPAVMGTPNGNDFPDGKPITYTYTKNTGQPGLDHNLLTVERQSPGSRAVFIKNLYTTTTNPASPSFDRIQKQVYADDPFTAVSYVYVVPPPGEEPGAVTKTIVRDRVGNVSDTYFDPSNRVVAVRQYTGRAPSLTLPTGPTTNRPGAQLRSTDPPFFRTGFTWNAESLITGIIWPKLGSDSFTYDSSNTDVKRHANLLQHVSTPGPVGADQPSITQSWTYATSFGEEPCQGSPVCGDGSASSMAWSFPNGPRQTTSLDRVAGGGHGGGGGGGCGGRKGGFLAGAGQTLRMHKWRWSPSELDPPRAAAKRAARTGRNPQTGKASFRGYTVQATQAISDALSWTRRGMNSNVRSTALLGVDRGGRSGGGGGGVVVEQDIDQPDMGAMMPYHEWRWSTYTDGNGRTYSQTVDPSTGHVTQTTAPPVSIGQPAGTSQAITDSWTYNSFGQVVSHTDPTGHIDAATYFTSGPQKGYLESLTVDAPGSLPGESLHLVEVYGVDEWGNTTSVTDPNGNTETCTYNQLDQLVRHVSAPPFSYTTGFRYNDADCLVRTDEDNLDETGAFRTRPHVFTIVGHDPLNRPAFVVVDGPGALDPVGGLNLRSELSYDGDGDLTLVRRPAAVSGAQPHDVVRLLRDERGLLFRMIDAEGDPTQSTTQWDHDADGGMTAIREGLESSPRVTVMVRDGYGRPVQATDPAGNVSTLHYDANDQLASSRLDGELTDGESGSNVRLAESTLTYDEIGRPVQLDRAFFDTQTGAPLGDGTSTTKTFYDERSQVTHTEDDDGRGPSMVYDGAGRLSTVHDPVGNTVDYAYDANGNVLTVTETEVSDNPGLPPQVFTTSNTFDALDRPLSTSQAGVTHSFAWDSRHRVAPSVMHDGRSNTTRLDYDDAGRLVATHKPMTDDGTGSGTVSFVLDATRSHDDGGRLTSQTDDNGNTTSYTYDAKGRVTATTNPDGTSESYVYNVHDDLVTWTDPNGTVVTSTFDALGRLKTRTVARAAGVLGTTSEIWKYDGLSRVVSAQNNDALVTRRYDSLSDVTTETSAIGADGGRNINWDFTGGGTLLSVTYPSGHNMGMVHDTAGRVKSITSSGPGVCSGGPPPHAFCTVPAECGGGPCVPLSPVTTTYGYMGPDRVVQRDNGNGTRTDISYDPQRRVSQVTVHLTPGDVIDDRSFTWDDDSNKTSRSLLSSPGAGSSHHYTYDSASRMVHSLEERPGGLPPISIDYTLDGASNRTSVTGGTEAGTYSMSSSVPEPADRQMNQYTSTPWDGSRAYDRSGNLVSRSSGGSTLSYDYRGRLILVSGSAGSGSYAYDVFGRRVLADGKRLYYDWMEEIEERSPGGALTRLDVHGRGLDESLIAVADWNSDGQPDRVFHQTDDLSNVVVAMDESGNAIELYDYSDFGRPRFLSATGVSIPSSAVGNPFLFGGHRYDASTGLYDLRTRHLDPRAGRFVSRDSIGTWGDSVALGNATAYAGNNPSSSTDPTGTAEQNRSYLYNKFENGDIPDQTDFADTIDSALNLEDDGLTSYRNGGALSYAWEQVSGPIASSARFGRPAINTALNNPYAGRLLQIVGSPVMSVWGSTNKGGARMAPPSSQAAYSNFVAVPDRVRRKLVLVSGSSGSASLAKLCPGHISCPTLPPSVLEGVTNPLGLSASRGIAVDCRLP